ncbi:zinc finger FYVE domain-containing protein 26 [Syngnathoides biaculeatus]|uniref:zinc finger FYVE domain-containing protein 26 n=1 Tax=Syngnathoides biaculeatus TaxID=300417 RepID=UPI002ADE0281|nr:zinc finger FYVE domain-containing protein 26 [Syngnathoides biaculeatus]
MEPAAAHPFGREAEVSLRDLFDYFKRCLRCGEWELAAACVPQLVSSADGVSEKVREIIKAAVRRPYRLKWESVGSPHKLAWFWLQVLERRTEERVSPSVRSQLEFLLLLEHLRSEGIEEVLLQQAHEAFTQSTKAASSAHAAVERCLRTLLEKKKPRLAQSLAHFLQTSMEDESLQQVFVLHLLSKLEEPEPSPERRDEWVEEIYSVLAVTPWHPGGGGGQLEALCEALWASRGGPLKEERVLGTLIRPGSDALVSAYCSAALRLQRDRLLRSSPDTRAHLPEAEKLALSLCCHDDRPPAWKIIYFECLSSGKHFLEQVLVTALDLIKHEDFSRLRDMLDCEFQPLCRLVLLLGWTHCSSLSSAQTLLDILHHQQGSACDSVLQDFADLLSSQLAILVWCKNNNPSVPTEALLGQLHSLDNHSALYILHSLTPLAHFDERRILDLLQQTPNPAGSDAEAILSPAAERSVVLFRGFCAMKYAVYALCVNAHKNSGCARCQAKRQKAAWEGTDPSLATASSSEDCQSLFQHYLSECQLYLEAVPAAFRLELLENIFSLLFLSSADFAPQSPKDATATNAASCSAEAIQTQTEEDLSNARPSYLDLFHLVQDCKGFLADVVAMEGFLKLLKEALEGMCSVGQQEGQETGRALAGEAETADTIGCSVAAGTFGARLQRLSKRTAEAQWRLQIITSNQASGRGSEGFLGPSGGGGVGLSSSASRKSSSWTRSKKSGRDAAVEKQDLELSASASEEGGDFADVASGSHGWLIPAMLSPPESLLISCIQHGNFMEAHQVSLVFDMEASASCGELAFMECFEEVLVELGRVEQKMESQSLSSSSSSSEGLASGPGPGSSAAGVARSRLGSSGRSTLQAIGSAAAAGVAFYSISDIANRLLSTPARPLPSLQEGYWTSRCPSELSGLAAGLLEELSPPAMAAFDLACCHCQLWKTSRQLLDTAERRLSSSLEARGVRVDPKLPRPENICGFPLVLQQISKILNHPLTCKSAVKLSEASTGEEQVLARPFGCCIQEVLLCCHPTLSEECISARLALMQRLESTLHVLSSATSSVAEGVAASSSSLAALLSEQAGLKAPEADAHPARSGMKQLLRSLDQLCPFEPDGDLARPDFVRTFLHYVDTLAAVLVRGLGSEDQASEVKLGNPLPVLLQAPSQLLSYMLFERQVSPDRLLSLLREAGLGLSVQEVIIQRCCTFLLVGTPFPEQGQDQDQDSVQGGKVENAFSVSALTRSLQRHAGEHASTLAIAELPSDSTSGSISSEETTSSTSSANLSTSPPTSAPSFLLTPSALAFLKSRSPVTAALACLSVCKGEGARAQPSGWSGYFRSGRKEAPLDGEQISREADTLLRAFPVLRAYLSAMAEPVLGPSSSPDEDLGAWVCGKPLVGLMLAGPLEDSARGVAAEAFQQALASKDVDRALRLLELYGPDSSQQGELRDGLLAWAALEGGEEGVGHLFRVQDANLRARVALRAMERWPLSASTDLLEFCLDDANDMEASLRADLSRKKKELDIYGRMLALQPPLPWVTWQELRAESKVNSEYMLAQMLEAKEFLLCADWAEFYPVSEQSRVQLQTEHLLHLLEKEQTDEAFQLLEGLGCSMDVCERALDRRPGLSACHFLADYVTQHFQRQVSPARRRHIHTLNLGSKVLLALPPAARQDYFPLLSEPLLMLEQMLMNLKVDWADGTVRTLRGLLVGEEAGFGADDVDGLLAEYARKALDFTCAPRERSRSDSVMSLQEALMQCPAQESSTVSSGHLESPAPSTGGTPSTNSGDRGSAGRKRSSPAKFQPPEHPPDRKDWVPDTQQHVCMVCRRERFTMFNRRHHCRRCGRLVCQACSERKMLVEGRAGEDVRVCDQCYAYFHPDSDEELEPCEATESLAMTEEDALDGMLHLPEIPPRQIRLSADPVENQRLRNEFCYEQAPSAHLCVAILSLHGDQTACGHQLIGHCRSLSRKLTNPEVDPGLLTDIMRRLLFSAKLMFVKVGRNQDLALCDSYISKVDVLKILVAANYKHIPSLDDILETLAVTRLRNQLLEAEYYQLAVEVSTKSGLDPGAVWQAWAMASLKAGSLTAARKKFARCLKAPVDRNQMSMGPTLLQEIVKHLETTVRPATLSSEDVLASLQDLEEALSERSEYPRGVLHEECLYYLNAYGTHLALVSFHMRHDAVAQALSYVLTKDAPEEVFLEGVLQPALERGRLGMFQDVLEKLDPGLEVCSRYLIASCQWLQRRGYFHTLYQIQQFMMDHVRAAMTCIRFFTHGATSYQQLGDQQRWLVRAKEHLRTYLQEQQCRGGVRRKSSQGGSFRKMMSSSDVSRHMNTIELQLEVTRFLHRREPPPAAGSGPPPPTLFGGSPMKAEVACKVMLGGKNIEEGFGIAYRVIQDFQLEAQAVYVRAGQRLVRHRKFGAARQLLKCVSESGTATKSDGDALVLSCVEAADKGAADAKEVESLILETKSTEVKIKAYLLCNKLRPAYLLAVKMEASRAGPLVQKVLRAAEGAQDSVMQNICRQWLQEHHHHHQGNGKPRAGPGRPTSQAR